MPLVLLTYSTFLVILYGKLFGEGDFKLDHIPWFYGLFILALGIVLHIVVIHSRRTLGNE